MGLRQVGVSIAFGLLGSGVGLGYASAASGTDITPEQIEGKAFRLERAYLIVVHAPVGDVTIPIRAGSAGIGRLRALSKNPSAASFFFNCSNAT